MIGCRERSARFRVKSSTSRKYHTGAGAAATHADLRQLVENANTDRVLGHGGTGRERRELQAKQRREILGLDRHLRTRRVAIPFDRHHRPAGGANFDAFSIDRNLHRWSGGSEILAMLIRGLLDIELRNAGGFV